jgi:hypothetical protein
VIFAQHFQVALNLSMASFPFPLIPATGKLATNLEVVDSFGTVKSGHISQNSFWKRTYFF